MDPATVFTLDILLAIDVTSADLGTILCKLYRCKVLVVSTIAPYPWGKENEAAGPEIVTVFPVPAPLGMSRADILLLVTAL